MTFTKSFILVIGLASLLAGCAETVSTPAPISADPVLTKYDTPDGGGGGCPSGQVPGATGICYPPDDNGDDYPRTPQTGDGQGGRGTGTTN